MLFLEGVEDGSPTVKLRWAAAFVNTKSIPLEIGPIENKRVNWYRVDGKLPKLDVAGSIPVSRSIFSIT